MTIIKTAITFAVFIYVAFFLLCIPGMAEPECPHCQIAVEGNRVLTPREPAIKGPDVEQLQIMLKELDYYNGQVNGLYDPGTVQAVKDFQLAQGSVPNGVVIDITWDELEEARAELAAAKGELQMPSGEVSILIDTYQRKLTVLSDGEPYKQYAVACGKNKTPTPIGSFGVLRRARNWGTGFGTRWIGLTVPWGIFGIHGTNKPGSIGSYASHGCIRMNNVNVEEIYPWVKPGTRVILIGNPFTYQPSKFRTMRRDERGGDVLEVQVRLKRLGFYDGPIDGIWGGGMEKAVIKFREHRKLPRDNSVDEGVYKALGL